MGTFMFYTTLFIFSVYSATNLLSSTHFCRMSVSYLNNAFWLAFVCHSPQRSTPAITRNYKFVKWILFVWLQSKSEFVDKF